MKIIFIHLISIWICLTATTYCDTNILTLDPDQRYQTIRGHGGSGAWHEDEYMRYSAEERAEFTRFLFDPEEGIGLNIYRTRVYPNAAGTNEKAPFNWQNNHIQAIGKFCREIQERYDVTIFVVPWTPPRWMKDNQSSKGGSLAPEFYPDYAAYLTEYIQGMKTHFGVTVDILSVQNESDSKKTWDSCVWEPEALLLFTRDHLIPALDAANLDVKLMLNEETAWRDKTINTVLADPILAKRIDIAAAHIYWGSHNRQTPFTEAQKLGLDVWMTEFYYGDYLINKDFPEKGKSSFSPNDRSIVQARIMHQSYTLAETNAYLVWWLLSTKNKSVQGILNAEESFEEKKEGPLRGWTANKWAYGLGQFSKFIRPGYQRIHAGFSNPTEDVLASAYAGESGKLVSVLINQSNQAQTFTLKVDQKNPIVWQPTRTSETENLAPQPALESEEVNVWEIELPPRSITTLSN